MKGKRYWSHFRESIKILEIRASYNDAYWSMSYHSNTSPRLRSGVNGEPRVLCIRKRTMSAWVAKRRLHFTQIWLLMSRSRFYRPRCMVCGTEIPFPPNLLDKPITAVMLWLHLNEASSSLMKGTMPYRHSKQTKVKWSNRKVRVWDYTGISVMISKCYDLCKVGKSKSSHEKPCVSPHGVEY